MLEVGQAGGKRATNEVVVLTCATMREKEDRSVRARQLERERGKAEVARGRAGRRWQCNKWSCGPKTRRVE